MSSAQILALGTIAGSTIFLGLPLGRLQKGGLRLTAALSAFATGILIFLLVDVLEHGFEPVEEALLGAQDGGSWGRFVWLAALLAGGVAVGAMSLVYYDGWMKRERDRAMLGPGAASVAEFEQDWVLGLSPDRWLAV